MRLSATGRAIMLASACTAAACTGVIGDAGSNWSNAPPGADGTASAEAFPCTTTTPASAPTPLLLLTRAQYINTLHGLFGDVTPSLDAALGADPALHMTNGETALFGLVQANLDLTTLTNYQTAAETVAAAVVGNAASLAALVPCAAGASKRDCAQRFVKAFGAIAYRAPLADEADVARHMALYDAGAAVSDAHGIELLLRGMLQSPRFLYRVEIGAGSASPNATKLTGYEVAARLSYVLWNALPDQALLDAAATGKLETKEQVASQLKRMIQDPKGQGLLPGFLADLIKLPGLPSLQKAESVYPTWTNNPSLATSMQGQARAFFQDLLTNQGGTLSALFTSSTVFFNRDLADYYGGSAKDAQFQRLTMPAGSASGILTLPALLTSMSKSDQPWPIYRGKFVREVLLCQTLPSPPPNIPAPPSIQPGVSVRERLKEHETNPSCSGCHAMMDPIGFGFSNYDGLGHFQTTDGAQPVDVHGTIGGAMKTDIDGDFTGVAELAQKLASSTQVRQCVARQWFRYAMGRYEQAPDNCSMKAIDTAFHAANASLSSLPEALVQSDAFLYRSAP